MMTKRLTLTFDHMTWKSIGILYSTGAINVQNLLTNCITQRFLQDIEWTTLFNEDHKVDLDLWPCKLKIDRDYLLSRGNHRIKFDARGQQILRGQHLIYRSTKGGYNKRVRNLGMNVLKAIFPRIPYLTKVIHNVTNFVQVISFIDAFQCLGSTFYCLYNLWCQKNWCK